MIAKPEWFVTKKGIAGKTHFIPVKAAGWLYYLGVFIAIGVAQYLFRPLVIAVIIMFVADMIIMAKNKARALK